MDNRCPGCKSENIKLDERYTINRFVLHPGGYVFKKAKCLNCGVGLMSQSTISTITDEQIEKLQKKYNDADYKSLSL